MKKEIICPYLCKNDYMQDCAGIVEQIYTHPDLINFINKIKPESIRDDLRQEMAINLLTQPCEKISALFVENNLLRYSIRMCWKMTIDKNNKFFRSYRKNDYAKAVDYMLLQLSGRDMLPHHLASIAHTTLTNKNISAEDEHEARVFNTYVKLGSSRAVARYYNIPLNHVCTVVAKVKKELKCILLQ